MLKNVFRVSSSCLFPKLLPTPTNFGVKLDEKAIKWIIREKEKGTPTRIIAEIEGISTRRVNQIYKQYKENKRACIEM